MMGFGYDETHEDIRQAVRQLCGRFGDEYWAARDRSHEFPWDFYQAVVDGGWLGLTVPEEYGGGGLGVTEAAIVEQEISASGAGMNGCRSEEHTSELQSRENLVCRLLLEKKK